MASDTEAGPGRAGNRIVGAAVLGFALALWFWLIPWQVDASDTGFMRPQTMPQICAAGLALAGLALMVFPAGRTHFNARGAGRTTLLLALAFFMIWLMGKLGFLWAAPALSAVLALALGERRWPWLAAIIVGLPLFIWLVVEPLLGRSLP